MPSEEAGEKAEVDGGMKPKDCAYCGLTAKAAGIFTKEMEEAFDEYCKGCQKFNDCDIRRLIKTGVCSGEHT